MATLSKLSNVLISGYDRDYLPNHDAKISVNPVVAEMATWYEKFRTAMEYREEEVILRSSIERILKRRLLLGGNGESVAAPLIRELVWARYFPDSSVPESIIAKVSHTIDLYLKLEKEINDKQRINRARVNEWMIQLLSCDIQYLLKPNDEKDLMCNFIFLIFKDRILITDDTEETRDVQVFIAVRRAFAKDDLAFIRFHLFKQYFGNVTSHTIDKISDDFLEGLKSFESHLKYPLKDKIYGYIKKQIVPFLILDDVLRKNRGHNKSLILSDEQFNLRVLEACNDRYKGIKSKVQRAIIRSVIFIFFTKAIFALSVEGTFENLIYGKILWTSMGLNILTPPILMIIVGLMITTPSKENSFKILRKIQTILFDEKPLLDFSISLKRKPGKTDPILSSLFFILWLITFILSFGAIIFVLTKFNVNYLSQGIFVFFLAIVSFVSYRINQTAHMYVVRSGEKESLTTIAFDFFFMPFIQVGRRLTLGMSQLNIVLFIFDFIIETPFKGIFAFFEQWFLFLRTQREKLE